MTGKQLLAALQALPEEALSKTLTITDAYGEVLDTLEEVVWAPKEAPEEVMLKGRSTE